MEGPNMPEEAIPEGGWDMAAERNDLEECA